MEMNELFLHRINLLASLEELQGKIAQNQQLIDTHLQSALIETGILTAEKIEIIRNYGGGISLEIALHRAISLYIYCLQNGTPFFENLDPSGSESSYTVYPGAIEDIPKD